MKFIFDSNDGKDSLQLPVNPPVFHISDGSSINTIETLGLGEITMIGKEKLIEITLESHFPAEPLRYFNYVENDKKPEIPDVKAPYEYIELLKRWKSGAEHILLTISDTPVKKLPMIIENLTYGEEGGSRDVKYELQLREYRSYKLKPTTEGQKVVLSAKDEEKSRKDKVAPGGIYIVKAGDSLWKIARLIYGNGSRYREIMTGNKLKSDLILVGQRLKV